MAKKTSLFLCIAVCLAAAPQLWAEEAAEVADVAADQRQNAVPEVDPEEGVKPQQLPRSFEEILDDELKAEVAGCSAWYPCVHGGSVSCSAPFGTCESSGQRCGRVTCNGETTWCPGACMTTNPFTCARFCHETYGSTDGTCDSFGCCVCF